MIPRLALLRFTALVIATPGAVVTYARERAYHAALWAGSWLLAWGSSAAAPPWAEPRPVGAAEPPSPPPAELARLHQEGRASAAPSRATLYEVGSGGPVEPPSDPPALCSHPATSRVVLLDAADVAVARGCARCGARGPFGAPVPPGAPRIPEKTFAAAADRYAREQLARAAASDADERLAGRPS